MTAPRTSPRHMRLNEARHRVALVRRDLPFMATETWFSIEGRR